MLSVHKKQGRNIGIVQACEGAARVFPPLLYSAVFDTDPYLTFQCAACISGVGIIFSILFYGLNYNNPKFDIK